MATPLKTHLLPYGEKNTSCGKDSQWFRTTNDTRLVTCRRCKKRVPAYLKQEFARINVAYDALDGIANDLWEQREACGLGSE
jgi:predicted nucleic acid-binding Zn ribbon protein